MFQGLDAIRANVRMIQYTSGQSIPFLFSQPRKMSGPLTSGLIAILKRREKVRGVTILVGGAEDLTIHLQEIDELGASARHDSLDGGAPQATKQNRRKDMHCVTSSPALRSRSPHESPAESLPPAQFFPELRHDPAQLAQYCSSELARAVLVRALFDNPTVFPWTVDRKCKTPSRPRGSFPMNRDFASLSFLLTAYCLLLTAYCLLPTAYCLLTTALQWPCTPVDIRSN
jgi:hypothetical protein